MQKLLSVDYTRQDSSPIDLDNHHIMKERGLFPFLLLIEVFVDLALQERKRGIIEH